MLNKYISGALRNAGLLNQLLIEMNDLSMQGKEVTYSLLDTNGVIGQAASTVAAGDDDRFPTADQKAALPGYDPLAHPPNAGNPYVTIDSISPLLGGNYKAGTITQATTATVNHTGIGFQPKFIIALGSNAGDAGFAGIGFATGSSAQYNIMVRESTGAWTFTTNKLMNFGINSSFVLDSFDADGFTISYTIAGSDDAHWSYLVGK